MATTAKEHVPNPGRRAFIRKGAVAGAVVSGSAFVGVTYKLLWDVNRFRNANEETKVTLQHDHLDTVKEVTDTRSKINERSKTWIRLDVAGVVGTGAAFLGSWAFLSRKAKAATAENQ